MFRISRLCLVVTILSVPAQLLAQFGEREDDLFESIDGINSSLIGSDWKTSTGYNKIKGFAKRPEAGILGKVTVEWLPIERDSLGNVIRVRGQLQFPDGGKVKPVNWFQGVTVYMAKSPDVKLEMVVGNDQPGVVNETGLVNRSGIFTLRIDLRKTRSQRHIEQSFQFGLSLATHAGGDADQNITWASEDPVLASSRQMLRIPPAPQLSRELELINQTSGWPFENPDGTVIIRAVNALHALGKERALNTLEKYVELAKDYPRIGERDGVFWIIRLLFEPIQAGKVIPAPGIPVHLIDRGSPDVHLWPLNPIEMVGDVPLMVGSECGFDGQLEEPMSHISLARRDCVLREHPLSPTMNPLSAAQVLLSSAKFRRLHDKDDEDDRAALSRRIREQALAMVPGLLKQLPDDDEGQAEEDVQWKVRLAEAQERNIAWDAKEERFVSQKK